jgi:hypothetical protein
MRSRALERILESSRKKLRNKIMSIFLARRSLKRLIIKLLLLGPSMRRRRRDSRTKSRSSVTDSRLRMK